MNKITTYNMPLFYRSLQTGKGLPMFSSRYSGLKTHEIDTCRANNGLFLIRLAEEVPATRLSVAQRRTIKHGRSLLSP
jgi:hypothetical protein